MLRVAPPVSRSVLTILTAAALGAALRAQEPASRPERPPAAGPAGANPAGADPTGADPAGADPSGAGQDDPGSRPGQGQQPSAQPAPERKPQADAPIVVTASRREEDPFRAPYQIDVVGADRIRQRSYRTTPQALRDLPSVLLQETSPGQGSPFIRGFTSFRNLFLIDGVRLNNSVFRPGPNQYWNTVDPLSLDRLELLRGPASAQWGSDAIGGTVQAVTRSPYAWAEQGTAVAGSSYVRYATAEDSIWGRGEVSVGQAWDDGSRTGFLLGGDAKAFGDMEGGDSTGTQPNTGYEETAFDVKVEHWLSRTERLVFLHQQVAQDDVPRTHSTVDGISWRGTSVGSDLRRNLDQNRRLTYLQYHATELGGALDGLHANLSWHEQDEVQDRIRGSGEQVLDGFDVGTLGMFLQADSDAGELGRLSYGIDYYRDEVDSFRRNLTAPNPADDIQGPVGDDASYDLLGVFVQDAIMIGDSAELILGGRYTYAAADADSVRDPQTNTQIAVSDSWDKFTGNARLRVDLDDSWNVYGGVSQGFRAPNLRDLTSFDVARSGEVEVPAPGLSPEEYISYEVGTKVRTGDVSGTLAYYYTDISDQILRFPTGGTIGGDPVVTKANVGDGHIQGVELQGAWQVCEASTVFGMFSYQYGRLTNFNAGGTTRTEDYPSRLMPIMAQLGYRWAPQDSDWWFETLVTRAEDADKLSAGDMRDSQRIPPGGTPSYTVWNARAGVRINERAMLDFGVDNITDVDYRVHGSGSNSLGRNFVFGLTVSF